MPAQGRIRPLPDDPDITLPLEVTPLARQNPPQTAVSSASPRDWRRVAYKYAALFFALSVVVLIVARYAGTDAPPRHASALPPPLHPPDLTSFVDTIELQLPVPQIDAALEEALASLPVEREAASRGASAARRECMAQIESANLFLGLARNSTSNDDYATAVDTQADRLLASAAIDQRTLATIADQAWTNRVKPELTPDWWTKQYQRCEARRIAGATYVVRSD